MQLPGKPKYRISSLFRIQEVILLFSKTQSQISKSFLCYHVILIKNIQEVNQIVWQSYFSLYQIACQTKVILYFFHFLRVISNTPLPPFEPYIVAEGPSSTSIDSTSEGGILLISGTTTPFTTNKG